MPNNNLPGQIEDFVAILIPAGDAIYPLAKSAVEGIPKGVRRFASAHAPKAFIHTWLAWQKDPGTPMGLAITKQYLDAAAPACQPFLSWIRLLFGP